MLNNGLSLLLSLLVVTFVMPAQGQDFTGTPSVQRGRTGDASSLMAARRIVGALGSNCDVTAAILIGRAADDVPQYEVRCRTGPGLILVDGPEPQAVDCLTLEAQYARRGADRRAPRCRLPRARDFVPILADAARRAGLPCTVDEGSLVGRTEDGGTIYEVGCRRGLGGWISSKQDGWAFDDCMMVEARGGGCRSTTEAETLTAVGDWMAAAGQPECRPRQALFRGSVEEFDVYEVSCLDGDGWMVRRTAASRPEAIDCASAHGLGGGCILGSENRRSP